MVDDELVWDRARHIDVLLLDDLGKEGQGRTGIDAQIFETLLRERSEELWPTIIT